MRKAIVIISLICLFLFPIYGGNKENSTISKEIPVVPIPIRDNENSSKRGPRMPAINPLTVIALADNPADSSENVKTLQVVVVNGGENDAKSVNSNIFRVQGENNCIFACLCRGL